MSAWQALVTLGRLGKLHFPFSGALVFVLGSAAAWHRGHTLRVPVLAWGLAGLLAAELVVHYANEYFDLAADRLNPHKRRLSGGSRVLVEGLLPPWVALALSLGCALAALGCALVLRYGLGAGPLTAPLYLAAVLLSWAYSGPPFRLQYRGLGELSVAALVPVLSLALTYYLHAGKIGSLPLLLAVPLSCAGLVIILIIEFPDAEGDALAGKGTLVVRWGGEAAAGLHRVGLAATYAVLMPLTWLGLPWTAAVGVALSAPLALLQGWRMARRAWADPAQWDSLALWDMIWAGCVALGLLGGLLWDAEP